MKTLRLPLVLFALVALGPLLRAVTMIYPIESIEDLWTLGAEEFRQKYAGINISGLGPSDEGWYVRYRHENLTFLFGPVADREEARKRKWEMEAVRDAAIRNRPTLASSQVDFVKFSFSGVYGRGGDGSGGGADAPRISPDGKSGPDGDLDGDGIPNSKDDDMDGDGIPNAQDGDADGDGVPNGADDYMFGSNPGGPGGGGESDAKNGPDGDMDGDGIANSKDDDMDGDGIPNGQDGDADGDGTSNSQDKYAFGKSPAERGEGDAASRLAKSGGRDGQGGQSGQESSDGSESGQSGQSGSDQQKGAQRQAASNQRGSQSQSGQQGQPSQSGQQSQSSQQSSSSSSQSSSSSSGQPGQPSIPSPSGSPSSANPLELVLGLFRRILGI